MGFKGRQSLVASSRLVANQTRTSQPLHPHTPSHTVPAAPLAPPIRSHAHPPLCPPTLASVHPPARMPFVHPPSHPPAHIPFVHPPSHPLARISFVHPPARTLYATTRVRISACVFHAVWSAPACDHTDVIRCNQV
eukprot:365856-Chlamydomonas_euryale.AAC.6